MGALVDGYLTGKGTDLDGAAPVAGDVAPAVEERHGERRRSAVRHEARGGELHALRRPGDDLQHGVAGHGDVAGGPERVDVAAEPEAVLDEGLDPGAGPARPAVAEADDDAVPGVKVAVDHVDDHRLLEGPLVPLLVKAHAERLHGGRRLAGQERAGLVLGADIVRRQRVRGLEGRPVRVELEGRLEGGAVRDPAGADLVGQHHLLPASRDGRVVAARDRAEEGARLDRLVEAGRRHVLAEPRPALVPVLRHARLRPDRCRRAIGPFRSNVLLLALNKS